MNSENELDKEPLTPTPGLIFTTQCHPEANGRQPEIGDTQWLPTFTLEDGRVLQIRMGRQGYEAFRKIFLQMDADDAAERLLG